MTLWLGAHYGKLPSCQVWVAIVMAKIVMRLKGYEILLKGATQDKSLPCQIWWHRGFCGGDMMFSVVEEQDFTCFCLIPPLLFFFKERHLLCSHKQNFKIKRTLNKKIDSMFNEKKNDLGQMFPGKRMTKYWPKNIFTGPFMKHQREGGVLKNYMLSA